MHLPKSKWALDSKTSFEKKTIIITKPNVQIDTESGNNSTGNVSPAKMLRCASGQNELRGPKTGGPNKGKNSSAVCHLWGLVGQVHMLKYALPILIVSITADESFLEVPTGKR